MLQIEAQKSQEWRRCTEEDNGMYCEPLCAGKEFDSNRLNKLITRVEPEKVGIWWVMSLPMWHRKDIFELVNALLQDICAWISWNAKLESLYILVKVMMAYFWHCFWKYQWLGSRVLHHSLLDGRALKAIIRFEKAEPERESVFQRQKGTVTWWWRYAMIVI